MSWSPGDVIVERTVWLDTVLTARPLTVVSDGEELLAATVAIGTKWFGPVFAQRGTAMDEIQRGDVTWGERTWIQHHVLSLVRPDDSYAIDGFWNEQGDFVAWYVNLQEPMRRTHLGFDTRDQILDIIVGEDLTSWLWKDEHELDAGVQMGLHSPDEAAEIRRNGEQVIEMIERGDAWWGEWRGFTRDPAWPIPSLPEGWDRL